MALMMSSLYDALKAANVDDDKARKAAEEVATYDNQLAEIKATQKLHNWMLAFVIGIGVANLFVTFTVMRSLGAGAG